MREKVSTQEYQYPVPYIPVGAKYVFGNSPTKVIDSFVRTTTVREETGQVWEQGTPVGTDQEWVDYLTQVIVVKFQ